jgi:protocatechuate 3,4-dioxygenase beta subunit
MNYGSVDDYDRSTTAPDTDGDDSGLGPNDYIPVTLLPGEGDIDNDFVEFLLVGNISGYVSDDLGSMMAGVPIELYLDANNDSIPDTGTPLATDTTDAGGYYEFVGVAPGVSYILIEIQPIGYNSISDYDHTPDPDGDDSAEGADNNIPVTLTASEDDADNNFINGRPGFICGNVSDDQGNPLSNVNLLLVEDMNGDGFPDGDTVATTMTDGDLGNYCFLIVTPGTYVVVEQQPMNYGSVDDYDRSTTAPDTDGDDSGLGPNDYIPVNLLPGEGDLDNDFIEFLLVGNISGYVSDDAGTMMAGVPIELYLDANNDSIPDTGTPLATDTTDAGGYYEFVGVAPGVSYILEEVQTIGYNSISDYDNTPDPDGDDSAEGPDNNIPVTVSASEDDNDNNFVNGRPGAICGNVSDDQGNPLSNVTIFLIEDINGSGIGDGDTIATTTTDGDLGNYCFLNVTPGTYVVVENQPGEYGELSDYDHTPDPDGDDFGEGADNDIPVVLDPGEIDMDNNFIDILCPSTPAVVGNITHTICDGGTVTWTAEDQGITAATYSWNFGEGANPATATGIGPHIVQYDWTINNQTVGASVTLEITKAGCPSQNIVGSVIVNPYPDATINASTEQLCWFEPRTFIPAEAVIPGAIYTWNFGAGAIPATATGYGPHDVEYNSPGVKTVQLIVDPNFSGQTCPDTAIVQFLVSQCFGNIAGVATTDQGEPFEAVIIRLFEDTNADGAPDGSQIGITLTSASGQYSFTNLAPGDYVVVELPPCLAVSTMDIDTSEDGDVVLNVDNSDLMIPVTIDPQEDDFDNNFIITTEERGISGHVEDGAGNGISGVTIELFADADQNGIADSGTPLATTTTDVDGFYQFIGLDPGDYLVVETQPTGYVSVMDHDPSEDVDAVPNDDPLDDIIPVSISSCELGDADNDFVESANPGNISGSVLDDQGNPISGVLIDLFQDANNDSIPDGGALFSLTTSGSGTFSFDGVASGIYILVENQPTGYSDISDFDQTTDATDPDGNDSAEGADNDIPVTLGPGETDSDNIFVDGRPASVCGNVSDDLGNPIGGVMLKLVEDTNGDGVGDGDTLQTVLSDGVTGDYCFIDVVPGDYVVVEIQPDNYDNVSDFDNTTGPSDLDGDDSGQGADNDIPVTLERGEIDDGNDFIDVLNCTDVVLNTLDDGFGSLRAAIECVADGDTVTFDPSLAGDTIFITSQLISIDKNIVIYAGLTPNVVIKSNISGAFVILDGGYVEFRELTIVSGPSGIPAAMDIHDGGTAILHSVHVYRNPLLPDMNHILISNDGDLFIRGNTFIHQ